MQPKFVDAAAMRRSLPHGHFAAIPGMLRSRGIARIVDLAAPQSPLIDPGSKLACARALSPEPASSRLGEILGLGPIYGRQRDAGDAGLAERAPASDRAEPGRSLSEERQLADPMRLYDNVDPKADSDWTQSFRGALPDGLLISRV
ncbi:MAG: hypothetical protein OXI01_20580 [Albidovulum sp.]|nr:hypothetical protein [Albidovulum sp.]